jgi:hypothetical protein
MLCILLVSKFRVLAFTLLVLYTRLITRTSSILMMSMYTQKINEFEERIKDFLVKNPNITQQIIDNVIERGKSALVKKNADVITATECLVVSRLLCDLSARD